MTHKKKILMRIAIIALISSVFCGLIRIDSTDYYCQTCGSEKTAIKTRFPGWKIIPAIFEIESSDITLSLFYKDFFGANHQHDWCFDGKLQYLPLYRDYLFVSGKSAGNSLWRRYNYEPEFRVYIQQKIKNGDYTKQQIIEYARPENKREGILIVKIYDKKL